MAHRVSVSVRVVASIDIDIVDVDGESATFSDETLGIRYRQ